MKALTLFGAVVVSTSLWGQANAASFDCTKARSYSERTICSDPELSRWDDELGDLYRRARQATKEPREFTAENSAEWTRREQTCRDRPCLVAWYASRRTQLTRHMVQPNGASTKSATVQQPPPSHAGADRDLVAAQQQAAEREALAERVQASTAKLHEQLQRKTVSVGRALYSDLKAAGMAFQATEAGIDEANYSARLNRVGTFEVEQQLDGGNYVEVKKAFLWSVSRYSAFAPAGMRALVSIEGYPVGDLIDPTSAATSMTCRWKVQATRGLDGVTRSELGTWGCGPFLYGLVDDEVKAAAKRFIQSQLSERR